MNYGKLEMFLLVSVSYYFCQDLHTAAKNGDVELTERFLVHDPASESEKLDVNAVSKDSLGMTASMLAAERGHQDVLRTLVQAHAQLNLQNSNGNTCLHLAAQRREVETCRLLVESGADPLIRNLFQFRFADTVCAHGILIYFSEYVGCSLEIFTGRDLRVGRACQNRRRVSS